MLHLNAAIEFVSDSWRLEHLLECEATVKLRDMLYPWISTNVRGLDIDVILATVGLLRESPQRRSAPQSRLRPLYAAIRGLRGSRTELPHHEHLDRWSRTSGSGLSWSNAGNWSNGAVVNGEDLVFPAAGGSTFIPTHAIDERSFEHDV